MFIYCHCLNCKKAWLIRITKSLPHRADTEPIFFRFKIIKHLPDIQAEGFIIYVQMYLWLFTKIV